MTTSFMLQGALEAVSGHSAAAITAQLPLLLPLHQQRPVLQPPALACTQTLVAAQPPRRPPTHPL